MLIRNFRMITLGSQVLRSLQRFLHLLRVFVDTHFSKDNERNPLRQSRAIIIPSEARNLISPGLDHTSLNVCSPIFGRSVAVLRMTVRALIALVHWRTQRSIQPSVRSPISGTSARSLSQRKFYRSFLRSLWDVRL